MSRPAYDAAAVVTFHRTGWPATMRGLPFIATCMCGHRIDLARCEPVLGADGGLRHPECLDAPRSSPKPRQGELRL